jgi:hypothetical protein
MSREKTKPPIGIDADAEGEVETETSSDTVLLTPEAISAEYLSGDTTVGDNAFAYWHAIREDSNGLQQYASPRLTQEERGEIWQMCTRRFAPRSGSLPGEPVLLYWRLGNGTGNYAIVRVLLSPHAPTPAGDKPSPDTKPLLQYDTLVLKPEEFDKIDANPFLLLVGGVFGLIEQVGIASGQALLPLSVKELRGIPMASESSTPLPNLSRGHHVEYGERSLAMLRQWFSWLGKLERKQYSFASWWSASATEPQVPHDTFVISFSERRTVTSPEGFVEKVRTASVDLSRAIAALPVEACIRYPVLGYATEALGEALSYLQLAQAPATWLGEDQWSLKRKSFLALRKAYSCGETFVRSRDDASEDLTRVLEEIRLLAQSLTDELLHAPPPTTSATNGTSPTNGASGTNGVHSHPTVAQAVAPPTGVSSPSVVPKPGDLGALTGQTPSVPNDTVQAKISTASLSRRRLNQNYPKTVEAAPQPTPRLQYGIFAFLLLAAVGTGIYFLAPGLFGQSNAPSVSASQNASGANSAKAATTSSADNTYTIDLNTTGQIWTGTITASTSAGVAELRKLMPGSRVQTWDDMRAKIWLTIGAKPLIQGNTAKFGIIYRFHPDAKSPVRGSDVRIVSLKGDPLTMAIVRTPTKNANERFANQVAIYLARGLRPEDIAGFSSDVMQSAQKIFQTASSQSSKIASRQ